MDVSLTFARRDWHNVWRRVEAGEDIVLTRAGRPIARVVTFEETGGRGEDPKGGEVAG